MNDRLINLIDKQITRVIEKKIFAEESKFIVNSCQHNNLTSIIDFGSWVGILAKEILSHEYTFNNYHLVDCVPYYLELAKKLLSQYSCVTSQAITLVPPSYRKELPNQLLVHPYDTLNTSSLYSEHFINPKLFSSCCHVDIEKCVAMSSYITDNLERFTNSTYVKIDLDGCDIELVAEIIGRGLTPGAIQFEVWDIFKPTYTKLIDQLKIRGYLTPQIDLIKHKNFTVSISSCYWFAIGYDIVGNQYFSTYYDSNSGEQPISIV